MTKEKLIEWMGKNQISNEILAQECGVKKSTINSWRSNRPIPAKAALIIKELMRKKQNKPKTSNLNLTLADEQLNTIKEAAHIVQTPTRDYIIKSTTARARQDTELSK